MEIAEGIYSVSPALLLAQYALDHTFPEVVALAFELCGAFSLKESHSPSKTDFGPDIDGELHDDYYESDPAINVRELERQLKRLASGGGADEAAWARCLRCTASPPYPGLEVRNTKPSRSTPSRAMRVRMISRSMVSSCVQAGASA